MCTSYDKRFSRTPTVQFEVFFAGIRSGRATVDECRPKLFVVEERDTKTFFEQTPKHTEYFWAFSLLYPE